MMHRFELEGIHDRGSRDCDCLPGWRAQTCQSLLSGLSCREAAIRFGVSASSAIAAGGWNGCRVARRRRRFWRDRRSMRVDRHADEIRISRSKSSGRRWPRNTSGQAMARCGASFTATRSCATKTAHGTEQDRPDIVKRREPGSMASGSNLAFESGLGFRRDSRHASLADANRHFPFCHICR
jgi:hypothetical protein